MMEAYNLPIKLREWFVKRLKKQKDSENEAIKNASKGTKGSSTLGPGSSPSPSRSRPK